MKLQIFLFFLIIVHPCCVFEGSAQAESSGEFTGQIQGHVQGKYITTTTTSLALSTSEFSSSDQGYTCHWPMFLPAMAGNHM